MSKYTQYEHYGEVVTVRSDLQGKHREHCLCYSCEAFDPSYADMNCPIAQQVYYNCVDFNIVTPVWECPDFAEKKGD